MKIKPITKISLNSNCGGKGLEETFFDGIGEFLKRYSPLP